MTGPGTTEGTVAHLSPQASLVSRPGMLVCSDGAVFKGEWIGPASTVTGELVFNTVMSGYQEVITDPSYAGQVVAFTYPHIGNYGVTALDQEGRRPWARAIVVRDFSTLPSSWRAEGDLASYLAAWGVGILSGVDTRRLTRHVRQVGSIPCALGPIDGRGASDEVELAALAAAETGTKGRDLVREVTTPTAYSAGAGPWKVVAYDFGIKASIVSQLAEIASVEVVPAGTDPAEVLARRPDGVVLSNGPGDPAALGWAVESVGALLGEVPLFGICLGHQLLAQALGASTFRLPFGHHGGNHPVQRCEGGIVEITSQNHNYAVAEDGLGSADISHRNLNDGVVEGLSAEGQRAFSVQYHPEAGPGPHDARYLFARFAELMERSA